MDHFEVVAVFIAMNVTLCTVYKSTDDIRFCASLCGNEYIERKGKKIIVLTLLASLLT